MSNWTSDLHAARQVPQQRELLSDFITDDDPSESFVAGLFFVLEASK
jgi:hypothetical protein